MTLNDCLVYIQKFRPGWLQTQQSIKDAKKVGTDHSQHYDFVAFYTNIFKALQLKYEMK